ncbi:MAG: Gldg family protein [Planctomycetes bacterium]|nr:Gldg family protein [Planctomycetota bacterium]
MFNPVARAIFKRDLQRWFGNPTGYVFITLFVLLATAALFWPNHFFQKNLANLDTLNSWFPLLLLFFIPAVTMSVWAGERSEGTDELLFTLPATDTQIVLGKFLAAAGIYTVALAFTLPLLVLLEYLGDPDWGLMLANYFGFWLFGLVLISAGMVGSQLSDNLTVAFILGAILCGLVVMAETFIQGILPDLGRALAGLGPVAQFHEIARGVCSLSSLLLFAGLILAFLYLNLLLLSRRLWRRGELQGPHRSARLACILVSTIAITALGANFGARADLTSEQVHSLSDETAALIEALPADRTVNITAYVSPDVPASYVRTRRTLLDLLRQYDILGGDRVRTRVVETERFSDAAREAEKNFGINFETRFIEEEGRTRSEDLYLGLAFTCGIEEVVIPFLDIGLPVEYELTRSLRVVGSAQRRKVGILDNDAKVFGGFDFQARRQDAQWEVVRELELQYDVERVDPKSDYPSGLDVLIAVMPSSLVQEELDRLAQYVGAGHPALLIDDPFPAFDPSLGPGEPKGGQRNPFMQDQPPPEPKGDIRRFLRNLDIEWSYSMGGAMGGMFGGQAGPAPMIAWDMYNPHPQFQWEPEMVFISAATGPTAFNSDELVTSGLQEIVAIFGGCVEEGAQPDVAFTPLLRTSKISGVIAPHEVFMVDPFFGARSLNPRRLHRPLPREKTVACRVRGKASATAERGFDVIFLADADMVSSQFFEIRRRGIENLSLDNVAFLLNCVDELAGDDSFIELRKRRPVHRTLTHIEDQEEQFDEKWLAEKEKAEGEADARLAEAQQRLDERVAEVENRADLDEQSKEIQKESIREVEQRRLDVQKAAIEDQKSRSLEVALADKMRSEDKIRDFYRVGSVIITPLPAVLVGILTLLRRRRRESETTRTAQGGAA